MANTTCSPVILWIGTTAERFTVADEIQESSDVATYTPNNGTGGSTQLDFPWIMSNFNTVNRFTFRGDARYKIDTVVGDAHALIVIPSNLVIYELSEKVLGTLAELTQGIHYDEFEMTNSGETYTCIYLRDLTNTTFQKRQFKFGIRLT